MASNDPPQEKPKRKLNYQERSKLRLTSGLKKVSDKRQVLIDSYNKEAGARPGSQHCLVCGVMLPKTSMDRHHPKGRSASEMNNFVWVCRPCHTWIHENPKQAKEKGFLAP